MHRFKFFKTFKMLNYYFECVTTVTWYYSDDPSNDSSINFAFVKRKLITWSHLIEEFLKKGFFCKTLNILTRYCEFVFLSQKWNTIVELWFHLFKLIWFLFCSHIIIYKFHQQGRQFNSALIVENHYYLLYSTIYGICKQ